MTDRDTATAITEHSLVSDVLRQHPETLAVFLARGMHCPGCPMAAFMTVAGAAAEYGLPAGELLSALRGARGAG